jgi:hypothetical protein
MPVPSQSIAEQLEARSQENLRVFGALDEHDRYVYEMRWGQPPKKRGIRPSGLMRRFWKEFKIWKTKQNKKIVSELTIAPSRKQGCFCADKVRKRMRRETFRRANPEGRQDGWRGHRHGWKKGWERGWFLLILPPNPSGCATPVQAIRYNPNRGVRIGPIQINCTAFGTRSVNFDRFSIDRRSGT